MNHADKKKTEAEEGDFTLDDTVNPMQNSMQMTAAGDYDEESAMSILPTGEKVVKPWKLLSKMGSGGMVDP